MIDRKRLTLIIIGCIAAAAILAGLIVWLVLANQNNDEDDAQPDTSSQIEETPTITFTEEQQQTVFDVARLAAAWNGTANPETTQQRYIEAGMSESLARDYLPVWAGYFGTNEISQIQVNNVGSAPASIEYGEGNEHREPGTGQFRVGVSVNYEGTYHNGSTTVPIGNNTAIWYFILDERTGTVVDIEQPMLGDLDLPAPSLPESEE